MSMDKHIEQYSERRDSIRQELENLKSIVDESLKQKKKKEVLAQINTLKKDMELELSTSLSAEDKKKIEEINKSLDPMVSQELSDLQQEVKTEDQLNKEAPKKSFWEKTKDFWIKTKDVFTENPLKWLLYVGLWWLWIYSVVNFLKWRSEEEKKEHQKKSRWGKFWDNFWRATKAVAWTVTGYFGITWLIDLYKKEYNADMTDEEQQQLKDWWEYMKNNPEQAKKYMAIGTNVDEVYDHIMKKEKDVWRDAGMDLDSGYTKYADSKKIDKQTFQGIVPFCVDQEFWSVQELLSEWWYYSYLREKSWEDIKDEITNRSTQKILSFMPFLSCLSSAQKYLSAGLDPKKIVGQWAQDGTPTERQAELNLFFRQYGKLVVYMQDKKNALVEHIAAEKFKKYPSSFSSLEDAKDDKEWMDSYVYEDERYKNFYQWNMRNAYDVLTKENMMNGNLSNTITTIVQWSDSIREELLDEKNGKDVLTRLKESWNNLSTDIREQAKEACENTLWDIEDNFDETVSYPYLSSIGVAFNTKDNNIQEYLKESGLLWFKNSIKQLLKSFKQKFIEGTINKKELNAYINLTNQYFAFKKEILIASQSLQDIKSENSDRSERSRQIVKSVSMNLWLATWDGFAALWNSAYSFWNALLLLKDEEYNKALEEFGNSWKEFIKSWLLLSPAMIIWWYGLTATKYKQEWQFLKKMSMFHVWSRKLSYLNKACDLPVWILKKTRYNTKKWYELLLKDVMEGRISDEKLERIIAKRPKSWNIDPHKPMNTTSDFLKEVMDLKLEPQDAKLLFGKENKFTILGNESVRELLFSQTKKTGAWNNILLEHTLYNYIQKGDFKKIMKTLQNLDTKYNTLSWEQKKLIWLIMDDMKMDSNKLSLISKHIDKLNLSGMNYEQLKKFMNELSKNIDIVTDQNKLNKTIDDIKKLNNTIDNLKGHRLWNFLDAELQQLDKAIPKPLNLDAQKSRIQNLRKELQTLEKSELDQLWDVWSAIKQVDKNQDVISSLSDISKIWNATSDKKAFEQAMSELDGDALRKLNIVWGDVTNEMIERVAKLMWDMKLKQSIWIIKPDYMEATMKTVFKIFSKIT